MRPGQIALAVLDEREDTDHPAAVLAGVAVVAGGERAGADLRHVGQPAPGHRGPPALVRVHDLLAEGEILVEDRHVAVTAGVEGPGGKYFLAAEREDRVGGLAGDHVDQERAKAAVRRGAGRAAATRTATDR